MRLSDRQTQAGMTAASEDALPYPRSELAEPLITAAEARAAETAICRWHKGLIAESPTPSDTDGRVYFCPIGRQYWRYTKRPLDLLKPLPYPRVG